MSEVGNQFVAYLISWNSEHHWVSKKDRTDRFRYLRVGWKHPKNSLKCEKNLNDDDGDELYL